MSGLLMERLQFIKGIDPIADVFDTVQSTDVIDMSAFTRVVFVVYVGVGATGTQTFTIEACDDTTPTNTSAIGGWHAAQILTGDTQAAAAALQTSAGFLDTAGSSKIVLCEVREDQLASLGYRYVRLKSTESVNSPVLGGVLILGEAKNPQAIKTSAID